MKPDTCTMNCHGCKRQMCTGAVALANEKSKRTKKGKKRNAN